jgi:gamma-glutamyltranspeptidase/glutathione hydrolase
MVTLIADILDRDPPNLSPRGVLHLEACIPVEVWLRSLTWDGRRARATAVLAARKGVENRKQGENPVYAAASEIRADGLAWAY